MSLWDRKFLKLNGWRKFFFCRFLLSYADCFVHYRTRKKELGGGTVLDLGVYTIQVSSILPTFLADSVNRNSTSALSVDFPTISKIY